MPVVITEVKNPAYNNSYTLYALRNRPRFFKSRFQQLAVNQTSEDAGFDIAPRRSQTHAEGCRCFSGLGCTITYLAFPRSDARFQTRSGSLSRLNRLPEQTPCETYRTLSLRLLPFQNVGVYKITKCEFRTQEPSGESPTPKAKAGRNTMATSVRATVRTGSHIATVGD